MSFHNETLAWVALAVGIVIFALSLASLIIVVIRRYTYLLREQLSMYILFVILPMIVWVNIIKPALIHLGFDI